MHNPLLFLEYTDITPADFDLKIARVCYTIIRILHEEGAAVLTPIEVEQTIKKYPASNAIYTNDKGLDFLKAAYAYGETANFKTYYNRLKKSSLLRRLHRDKYDISDFYIDDKDIDDPLKAVEIQKHFDEATVESILNEVESKYNVIRNDFLNGGHEHGDPSEGIFQLIDDLQKSPSIGPELEGHIFSTVCRGARKGCFYLKSASTSAGKTRTSIFDACRLAYPIRWSHDTKTFVQEIDSDGVFVEPRKILFIVTEMDKEELQTIMLAYLSGVDEDHILTGKYEFEELSRVKYAAKIMKDYQGYFIIEEISEPNLTNIEATIKKYVTIDGIQYCFFDYIHTTASMMNQFAKNNLAEHSILMMMANQLKQIAKDYGIFIFSATQVNVGAMMDDGEFKNETCIRGSKAVSDKADVGYVMTRVSEKVWDSILPDLKKAVRQDILPEKFVEELKPTHIIDVYKMRRGRYKNVRIWIHLHLGTGYRQDLFMTTPSNQPIGEIVDIFHSATISPIEDWRKELNDDTNP